MVLGKYGMGNNCDGVVGVDLEVKVFEGIVVLDENGWLLVDLVGVGICFEVVVGGCGGLGNVVLVFCVCKVFGFVFFGEKG